jgi:predicted nuclease with RNAse H fold
MNILGIDLSGPRNVADTSVAVFEQRGRSLHFASAIHGANDKQIFNAVSDLGKVDRVVLGMDAPLSYNPGGGDRPSDSELRHLVLQKGRGVGVMPPTMIRMVYLTLRGVSLTRALETLKPEIELDILEVHPGASMLLRGAPAQDVGSFKHDHSARLHLLAWLEAMGLEDIPRGDIIADHFVAACAAALAAWQWSLGQPAWCFPARPPDHPYDFAC